MVFIGGTYFTTKARKKVKRKKAKTATDFLTAEGAKNVEFLVFDEDTM